LLLRYAATPFTSGGRGSGSPPSIISGGRGSGSPRCATNGGLGSGSPPSATTAVFSDGFPDFAVALLWFWRKPAKNTSPRHTSRIFVKRMIFSSRDFAASEEPTLAPTQSIGAAYGLPLFSPREEEPWLESRANAGFGTELRTCVGINRRY
jgi:hypothetical protein